MRAEGMAKRVVVENVSGNYDAFPISPAVAPP